MIKEKWISELKPGDKVVYWNGARHTVLKVEKVSPSGIVTAGNQKFNPDGELRGGGIWSRERINQWTPEWQVRNDIELADRKNQRFLKDFDFTGLTAEQRKNLVAYIKELTGEKE